MVRSALGLCKQSAGEECLLERVVEAPSKGFEGRERLAIGDWFMPRSSRKVLLSVILSLLGKEDILPEFVDRLRRCLDPKHKARCIPDTEAGFNDE